MSTEQVLSQEHRRICEQSFCTEKDSHPCALYDLVMRWQFVLLGLASTACAPKLQRPTAKQEQFLDSHDRYRKLADPQRYLSAREKAKQSRALGDQALTAGNYAQAFADYEAAGHQAGVAAALKGIIDAQLPAIDALLNQGRAPVALATVLDLKEKTSSSLEKWLTQETLFMLGMRYLDQKI